ncbi:MAG: MFS transporter [Anaerolineae bacterium]
MDNHTPEVRDAHVTRNVLALIGDFFFFSVGFAFYDPLVVMPAFVNEFTGSELIVGVLSALRVAVITLPQIWAASVLEARPRMKPFLIWSSTLGRLPVLVLAFAVLWWAETQTWLVIGILAITVMLFYTSEGLNGVSWPSLVGKVVPEGFRGRFFGLGQLLSSLGALAAGFLVNNILDQQAWARADRWAVLFICGFVGLMISVASMLFIREEAVPSGTEKPNVRKSLGKMWYYLRADRWLGRVILVQLILGMGTATFAFFVVRARQVLPGAEAMVGTFLILQSVGTGTAAVVGGLLVDHVGSWAAIRVTAILEALVLVAAALAGFGVFPFVLYHLVFLLMGYVNGASWWSFSVYLLALAPEDRRPLYLATSGVLGSITIVGPVVVGALMETVLPEAVFAGASVLAMIGLVLAWRLRRGIVSSGLSL